MADKSKTRKKSKETQKSSSSESEDAPDKQPKNGLTAAVPTNRKGSNESGGHPAAAPTKRKGSNESGGRPAGAANKRKMSNDSGGKSATTRGSKSELYAVFQNLEFEKIDNTCQTHSNCYIMRMHWIDTVAQALEFQKSYSAFMCQRTVKHTNSHLKHAAQDEVIPCEYYTSSNVEQPVKLLILEGDFGQKPITIMTVLRLNVEKYPDKKAYAYRSENTWQYITYKDLFELVKRAAKGFISFGLQRFYGVAIIGSNAPEWAIANIAAIYAGGIVVPISLAFSADECRHIIQSTRCSIVVVGSSKQLATVAQIRNRLLDIKAVIMYEKEEESDTKSFRFYTWDQLLAMGDKVDDERLQERLESQAPNSCCTITITPGTSGPSKQVMVSQDNFIWTSRSMGRRLSCSVASAVHIAVSNYSHVAGLIFNLYMPLLFASTVYYIPTMNMFQWAKEIQPTMFFAPYLAFEELRLKLSAQLARSRLSRIIYWWAKTIGHKGYQAMTNRRPMPTCWSLANRLVYQKIRTKIGMQSSREIFTSGRVFSREALEFFASLNIPVMEIYGMTESTGPVTTAAMPDMYRVTSAGKDLDGCSTKILRPDKDGVGELRIRGRNVFMGYLNQPDMTRAMFDKDGWLKSGDMARIDDDGFLYFCGKPSDLVTLKCGAAMQPGQMEARVLEALPIVRNCMLVGKGRDYYAVLLAIKTVVDWRTLEVSNTLTPDSREWFHKLGYKEDSIDKFLQEPDKRILNKIQAAFDHLNATLQPSYKIKKWTILPQDFSVQGRELTFILSIRRLVVEEKYAETINSMYIEK